MMAAFQLVAWGFHCGFHFGGILCHNMGCFCTMNLKPFVFLQHLATGAPAVQDRQISPHSTVSRSDTCSSSDTFSTEHMACCTTSLHRGRRGRVVVTNLDVPHRNSFRCALGGINFFGVNYYESSYLSSVLLCH